MCHLFLKMCPQMCPQMSLDYGALLWTLSHFQLKTREGKKKKAGRLCTFAALNLHGKNRTRHQLFLCVLRATIAKFGLLHSSCPLPMSRSLGEKCVLGRPHSATFAIRFECRLASFLDLCRL